MSKVSRYIHLEEPLVHSFTICIHLLEMHYTKYVYKPVNSFLTVAYSNTVSYRCI